MSSRKIIRAWKDESYRLSLSEAERALLPEHPAGAIELTDAAIDGAAGGFRTGLICRETALYDCWTNGVLPC